MIEALGEGLGVLLHPSMLVAMVIGVIIGLVIGIIPGIGGMLGITLLLPLVYRLPAEMALAILVSLHAVTYTGGGITSILLNIPGMPVSAVTCFDGFPMNQKGEGGRALGAALGSSTFGGILSVFFAIVMIPLLLPIILAFKSPEMCILVVLGLSCLAAVTGDSIIKGVISGALGLVFAMLGYNGYTGIPRFTFGNLSLYEGLGIIAVALGLFGLGEMIGMFVSNKTTIAEVPTKPKLSQVLEGWKDVFRHGWLWLRCTIIGYIIGIIPGVGAEASNWMCYAHAKQTSRHPELFGTGTVEGVIAPEAADNAKEAGDLLTTMAFGIPGGAGMALLIGAFLMVGVTPGPKMMEEHLPLAFTLLGGIALANLMAGVMTTAAAPYLVRVSFVHTDFMFPIISVIVIAGAFAAEKSMFNVALVIPLGLLGFAMKRFGYSRAAFILGFVLGGLFEQYIIRSVKLYGPLFLFSSPLTIGLLALVIFVFTLPYLRNVFSSFRRRTK